MTDNEPRQDVESRDQRVLSLTRLRECVIRDLTWLFNCENLMTRQSKIEDCPDAMRSVLNYGIPVLSGLTPSGRDPEKLQHEIVEAIRTFEPRLIRVHTQPKRAHQGWRYLTEDKAPRDVAEGEDIGDALPGRLAMKLDRLGLV